MFRLSIAPSATVCPFCEAAALLRQPWQSGGTRQASTLQTRKPSRMVLSHSPGRSPPRSTPSGKPVRKSRNSPFAAMNITVPPREFVQAQKRLSAADERRLPTKHGAFQPAKGRGKNDDKKKDPMKALKMQRALANVSYEKRNKIKQDLLDRESFSDFDLLPIVTDSIQSQALGGLLDISPTPIQRLAIPALTGSEDRKRRRRTKSQDTVTSSKTMQQFLLAAETGSGKTLAYVLPIIDAMKRAEAAEAVQQARENELDQRERKERGAFFEIAGPEKETPHATTGRPRAIILLPTAELVSQVGALIKSLSHTIKYRAAVISANNSGTVIRNRLFSPAGIDIVISTPHLLSSITESDPNVLSRVKHLIVDEADSLLDRSFSPVTQSIIDRSTPSLEQLVFCSATIPRSLDSYLNKHFPDVKRLATPNLHAIPRRVQLSVVDVDKIPYQGNRNLACAQTIWEIGKEAQEHSEDMQKKIVVFVNERETASEVAAFLQSKGIDASALSRDSGERKQAEILAAFTGSPLSATKPKPEPEPAPTASPRSDFGFEQSDAPSRKLANTKVLVMTDLGSRGIDTLLVKHVILYDVPHTSIDFIHRLGRVGRMGRRGRGVVLVGKNDRKDIVREVREGMFKGQAL
ncbi:P-loop containing nucleoside triphosphate hydrolase protein, partial [Polychaeton citri CBS 116435]